MALASDLSSPRYAESMPVNVRDLIDTLHISRDTRLPVMIWGEPGIGKSQIVKAFAESVGLGYAFITLASAAPEDVQGIPVFTGGIEGMIERKLIKAFRMAAERGCVLHIDEVTCGTGPMLGSILSAVQDRFVGDVALHPDTIVVMSGNPPGTTSGGTEPTGALLNRGAQWFLVPDVIDFSRFMLDRASKITDPIQAKWYRLAADLIELGSDRVCLVEFTPPGDAVRTWASPRAIENMIREIAACEARGRDPYSDPFVRNVMMARVGRKAGAAWAGIMAAAAKLPRPAQIAAAPTAAPTPTLADIDLALACVSMLPAVIAIDPAAAYVWADRFATREIRTLMHRTLTNAGAFPVGGFKGPIAKAAEAARQNLAASFNAIAAGK